MVRLGRFEAQLPQCGTGVAGQGPELEEMGVG
jgi:hypothetical protein